MAGICRDRKEFFRTVLESLRNTGSEYNGEYADFESIPRRGWEGVLGEYIGDVLREGSFEKNVDVDFENVGHGGEYTHGGLRGLRKLETGELFYCFDCGGDWECPVNAIIYVEDGKVKFHVPERGNNFDAEAKCAYGSEDSDESSDLAQSMLGNRIDRDEELREIGEFLHGIDSGVSDEDRKLAKELMSIVGARKEAFSSDDVNSCYFVTTSVWCLRKGRNGKPNTVCANGSNAYPNVFGTYEEAVNYVHSMMMANHNAQTVDWDRFREGISIIEDANAIPKSPTGYVHHKMENGVERFEGFDISGSYPCLFDDFIIVKRSVKALENSRRDGSIEQSSMAVEPVQKNHFVREERISEFTEQEQEQHQRDLDKIVDEMGGVDSLFTDSKQDEMDRMRDILGWGSEEDGQ